MNNDYQVTMANGDDHPLKDVPQEVLDCARQVLQECADCNDVANDMVNPIADAVVMVLHQAGHL